MAKLQVNPETQEPWTYVAIFREDLQRLVSLGDASGKPPAYMVIDWDSSICGFRDYAGEPQYVSLYRVAHNIYPQPASNLSAMKYAGTWEFPWHTFRKALKFSEGLPMLPFTFFGPSLRRVGPGKFEVLDIADITIFLRTVPHSLAIWESGAASEERLV